MQLKTFLVPFFCIVAASAPAYETSGWQISLTGTWTFLPHGSASQGAGSSSKLLAVEEAVSHHKASLVLRPTITRRFTFSAACVMQSPDPVFELEVPALDIRILDGFNGYVFARFRVDEGLEYSLRGEVYPPGRIVFAPITKQQSDNLTELKEAVSKGQMLVIALLQGRSANPRIYQIPLTGLSEHWDEVASDCSRLAAAAGNRTTTYLPDYLTLEGLDYAPAGFSLVPKDDGLAPVVPTFDTTEIMEATASNPIPFSGSGSRASIDAQGNVIMELDNDDTDEVVETLPDEIEAPGQLQIDESGMPVF